MGEDRPHFCIPTLDGKAHVVPVRLIEDWIAGRAPISAYADWEPIVRKIISEWLCGFQRSAAPTEIHRYLH